MEEVFYTEDHYWVSIENDIATVGLTNFVLDNFNIISFVDLPQVSTVCSKTELIGDIVYNEDEHFELYSPFSGEIVEVNDLLNDSPEQLFNYEKDNNWLFRIYINSPEELEDGLMSEEEYQDFVENI